MKATVIIPTMATKERSDLLKRAVDSIRQSSRKPVRIVVVVNGGKHDSKTCEWLTKQPDVCLQMLSEPSAPDAVRKGRELVDTEYFSTLDDDDELLPSSIDERLDFLESNPSIDVLITNGYRGTHEGDVLWRKNYAKVEKNPLTELMDANWLTSCNAMYRTSSISIDFFDNPHPYGEWTWLAYRIAMSGKKIGVLDQPTFRINDTPGSLSKTVAYERSYISLFSRMLDMNPPDKVARLIRAKLAAACHDAADSSLSSGKYREAMAWHLKSLRQPGGLKYLGFTLHFAKISTLGRR